MKKAFGDSAPAVESVAGRIEAIAAEIAEECYAAKHADKAKEFVKSVKDAVFMKKVMGGSGTGGLPAVCEPFGFDGGFGAVPSEFGSQP